MAAVGRGDSVDMGLVQINSKNLPALGLTVEQVFDPCTNMAAGAHILATGYQKAGSLGGALSIYNTGRPDSTVGANYAQSSIWTGRGKGASNTGWAAGKTA
jgi:type IV secretion system protein VirB1